MVSSYPSHSSQPVENAESASRFPIRTWQLVSPWESYNWSLQISYVYLAPECLYPSWPFLHVLGTFPSAPHLGPVTAGMPRSAGVFPKTSADTLQLIGVLHLPLGFVLELSNCYYVFGLTQEHYIRILFIA